MHECALIVDTTVFFVAYKYEFIYFLRNNNGTSVMSLLLNFLTFGVSYTFQERIVYGSRGLPVLYVDKCVILSLVKCCAMKMNGEWS